MTKSVADRVLDAALNDLKNNSQVMYICSTAVVTTFVQATAFALVSINVSGADWTGPANGDTSGRKITIGAKTGQPARDTANASAHSVVLVDTSNSALMYVTHVTATDEQVIVSGNTIDTEAWVVELRDPT